MRSSTGGRETPEAISFQMVAGPARELAVRLLEAVREIERKGVGGVILRAHLP